MKQRKPYAPPTAALPQAPPTGSLPRFMSAQGDFPEVSPGVVRYQSAPGSLDVSSGKHRAGERFKEAVATHPDRESSGATCIALREIFVKPMNVLLICVPFGIYSARAGWPDAWTFWLNFCAMIPLAAILGDATEALAAAIKNDTLSGLLNATFGNAVELIMTIMFLRGGSKDRFDVVKSTLLGSILSNMLLVLGMSFWFGGMYKWWRDRKQKKVKAIQGASSTSTGSESIAQGDVDQTFGQMGALLNSTMLLVTALILGLNTVFIVVNGDIAHDNVLPISRYCAIVMVLSYAMYIFFQMVTHEAVLRNEEGDGDEEEEEPPLSLVCSLSLLLMATAVVSYSSELLTDALEGALEGSGIGVRFTGIILLPIVGNACEHAAAVRFALQDRAGLSVGIAVGSSVQIAIFVYPVSVLMGWYIGDDPVTHENMDLNFGALNVAVLILSVLVVLSIVLDGSSNWLEGYMLCTAYLCIAVLYWYADKP